VQCPILMKNIPTPLRGHTPHRAPGFGRRAYNPARCARAHARTARAALVAVIAAFVTSAPTAEAARTNAPQCAGGYFVVDGAPLVGVAAGPDTLMVGAGTAATSSGCPATAPITFRALKKRGGGGDLLVVRWPSCGGTRVNLRATVSPDCRTVAGTVKAKGSKRRGFTAHDGLPSQLRETVDRSGMPPGAEIVNPSDFLAASKQPGFRIVSPRILADDEAAAAAEDAANQAIIDEFVAQHPEAADRMSIGVDPDDTDLVPTGDGNYLLTLRDADGNATGTVVTMGPRAERAMRAAAIRDYSTYENQLAIYRQRWAFANEAIGPIPVPEEIEGLTTEELTITNEYIASRYPDAQASAPLPGEDLPASYPAHCGNEIGYGDGTDEAGGGSCSHSPDGLYRTVSWPNKLYETCIRNQANRGTCVAFAITGGRELQLAKKYNRWVNLSEQHLYYSAKTSYQPVMYGDGLNGSTLLQSLFDTTYQQPLESTWDYNPSNSRTSNDATSTYMNSCTNYAGDQAGFCSDTAGQGRALCMQMGPAFVCAISPAPTTGITVRSLSAPAELWNSAKPSESLQNVEYAIYGDRTPVLISLPVVSSFDGVDKDGFVPYDETTSKVCGTQKDGKTCDKKDDCQCSRGGHAVLAVGLVYNGKLPEHTKKGAGGGYLIIRNSWGCSGDGGLYYLPLAWVLRFVNGARPIGDVEPSATLPEQPFDNYQFDFKPVPPAIHVVQPVVSEYYVAGQQIPLVADGADFQNDKYALLGPLTWTSNVQGLVGNGVTTYATLVQGTHVLTASYTGKLGVTATARTTVVVGPRPVDLPPTAYFTSLQHVDNGCPAQCSFGCLYATGYGSDAEDGTLTSDSQVRWYSGAAVSATGASAAGTFKYLGCHRECGTTTITLEVEDSAGQRSRTKRVLSYGSCVN
jgi:hypothetical protein